MIAKDGIRREHEERVAGLLALSTKAAFGSMLRVSIFALVNGKTSAVSARSAATKAAASLFLLASSECTFGVVATRFAN